MSKAKVLMAVALAAFMASGVVVSGSASAAWLVNGTALVGLESFATTVENMENAKLTFGSIAVTCTGKNVEDVSPMIESPNRLSAGSVTFTGCSAAGENCALVGTTISTVPVTAEVTLEGAVATKSVFSPKTKNTFATIVFSGGLCAIASEVQPVTGKTTVSGPTGQDEEIKHETIVNTTSGELKVGLTAATLKGKGLLKLVSGLPFSFR